MKCCDKRRLLTQTIQDLCPCGNQLILTDTICKSCGSWLGRLSHCSQCGRDDVL